MAKTSHRSQSTSLWQIEAEVAPGLEDIATEEITNLLGLSTDQIGHSKGRVAFKYGGEIKPLLALRTVISLYSVITFSIPRPKGILGHEHLTRTLRHIKQIMHLHSAGTFHSWHLAAAGSHTNTMQRIRNNISDGLGMAHDHSGGDLLVRLRPTPHEKGWDVLVRLTPRPLATRSWRIVNYPGALNASVAAAMLKLLPVESAEACLNIACGSGTILIEAHSDGRFGNLTGIDHQREALMVSLQNWQATGYTGSFELCQADIRVLPFPDASVDCVVADLPFGQLTGTHSENIELYPEVLKEVARVARTKGHFLIITHEVRLMEKLLSDQVWWHLKHERRITLSGLHPGIYLLERRT